MAFKLFRDISTAAKVALIKNFGFDSPAKGTSGKNPMELFKDLMNLENNLRTTGGIYGWAY